MKRGSGRKLLRKLLLRTENRKRFWPALISLCIGMVLLMSAVILWTGFRDILAGKYDKDTIAGTYLTISKQIPFEEKITEQKPALFTRNEIMALAGLPGVEDLGVFIAGRFPVVASFRGEGAQFSTNLFLETVPDRFIDNKPLDWYWQYSSKEVPVIISTEFLNLYNFGYAPNEGVPQLTRATISSLVFTLKTGKDEYAEEFDARVVGFSDRISSILVPEEFIRYGNMQIPDTSATLPSRLIVLVKDPSDKRFTSYLDERKYVANGELLRMSRLRTVVAAAAAGMGLLSIVILGMGAMVFMLFAELTLAKAKHNLKLLVEIGYSPDFLSRFMFLRYTFILIAVMIAAGMATIIVQVRVAKYVLDFGLHINTFPVWEVWMTLVGITLLLVFMINRIVVKTVK